MKNLKIILQLGSPVVINDFAPSLDGVLYQALSNRFSELSHKEITSKLKTILKYNETLGVFHASCLTLGFSEEQGITATNHIRLDTSAHRNLDSDFFLPNGQREKYKKVVIEGGRYKKRLHKYPSYSAPYAVFYCSGKKEEIEALLSNFVTGIGYDAESCSAGSILNVHTQEVPLDESLYWESGQINKYLPISHVEPNTYQSRQENRLTPPYYLMENRVEVAAPKKINAQFIG